MTFRVGQKVVCVDNSGEDCFPRPRLGEVYTIASLRWFSLYGSWGVTLVELPSFETEHCFAEYRASRFRPVVERKTDISIFKRMLLPQGVDA